MIIETAKADQDAILLGSVMKTTGSSEKQARELLLMDDDSLDKLCDVALSDIVDPEIPRVEDVARNACRSIHAETLRKLGCSLTPPTVMS